MDTLSSVSTKMLTLLSCCILIWTFMNLCLWYKLSLFTTYTKLFVSDMVCYFLPRRPTGMGQHGWKQETRTVESMGSQLRNK